MTGTADDLPEPSQPFLARLRGRLFHGWFLLRRPLTFGVRGAVFDAERNAVLLIRHTYVPGWHLPGGGVETGETAVEALRRELLEEGRIELAGPPELRSIHFNRRASRRDHVALYLVTAFRRIERKRPDLEIAEADFFALDELPEATSPATRRRLRELFDGLEPSQHW